MHTVPESHKRLIGLLEEKRTTLGLTHEQFAGRLGINRSAWNWVRMGQANPGLKVLAGIAKTFPDLSHEVLIFLMKYDPDCDVRTLHPQEAGELTGKAS